MIDIIGTERRSIAEQAILTGEGRELYWHGNAAKARIADEIVKMASERDRYTVLDFGAGRGGDWPMIVRDCPSIRLICYEPRQDSRAHLSSVLPDATIVGDAEIEGVKADAIVSFSVFEHVYDRAAYLRTAAQCLNANGTFWLNYDDGHFRIRRMFVSNPVTAVKEAINMALAPFWAATQRLRHYQKRVRREEANALFERAGFYIASDRYENLDSFKHLAKLIPPERRDDFARFWVDTETTLNQEFRATGAPTMGDTINLWATMYSRTVELTHRPAR